jgi:cobalt-zinc-cadmium efflux system membrane fusion protein
VFHSKRMTWLVVSACLPLLAGCGQGDAVNGAIRPSLGAIESSTYITLPTEATWKQKLTYVTAQSETLQKVVHATGQLQPDASAVSRISAPIRGKAVSVDVSIGETVAKGQQLMSLSSSDLTTLQSDYFSKQADIDADVARDLVDIDCDLKQTDAQIKLLQKQYDRAKLLFEEKIGSLSTLEQTQTELQKQEVTRQALFEKRQRTVQSAHRKKQLAQRSLNQQLELLGMPPNIVEHVNSHNDVECTIPIRTPQAGIVLERSVNEGELVDPGKVLLMVDDLGTLWLMADIFEQDLDKVKVGQTVEFRVDSRPSQVYKAKLDFVAGSIDPETRTLAVRANITNSNHDLKPKMFARLTINTGRQGALAIPADAVQELGSRKVVYVPRPDGTFEERTVEVGEPSGDMVEVLSGLKPGEKLVSGGSFMLRAVSLKQSN